MIWLTIRNHSVVYQDSSHKVAKFWEMFSAFVFRSSATSPEWTGDGWYRGSEEVQTISKNLYVWVMLQMWGWGYLFVNQWRTERLFKQEWSLFLQFHVVLLEATYLYPSLLFSWNSVRLFQKWLIISLVLNYMSASFNRFTYLLSWGLGAQVLWLSKQKMIGWGCVL